MLDALGVQDISTETNILSLARIHINAEKEVHMYDKNQENQFVNNYRAIHGGTKVQAMVEYRNLMKTNTPYTRTLKNETIVGFQENTRRKFYND